MSLSTRAILFACTTSCIGVMFVGCSEDDTTPAEAILADGGGKDTGTARDGSSSGSIDSGSSGSIDSGSSGVDGSIVDSGKADADAAIVDSGTPDADAAIVDSGTPDVDAGPVTDVDSGTACTGVPLGAPLFANNLVAAQPAPQGGTIVDGTYELTVYNHYGAAVPSVGTDPLRGGIKFNAGKIDLASQLKTDPAVGSTSTYTIDNNAKTLVQTNVCPTPGPGDSSPYTATNIAGKDVVKVYLDAEYVFTKK